MHAVALGAAPGLLAKAGIIARLGYVPTRRPEAHGRPVSAWALTDRDAAIRWLHENPDPAALEPAAWTLFDAEGAR